MTRSTPLTRRSWAKSSRQANSDGSACCIVGGGTKRDWGNRSRRFDLLVGTSGLRGFSDVDPDNLTLSVAAGTTVAEARAQADAVHRILPLDPGNPAQATIGGVAATGDQGARAAGYGGLRDVVLGIHAILADGSAVKFGGRTMKNVSGYDMTKLFVGSFGVLGVITEVTFRLLPRFDTQTLVVLALPSLEEAKASVARVLTSYLQPLALEVVSADALPSGLAGATAKLPAGRGAAAAPATAGAPASAGRPLLLAGFGGHRAAVDRSIQEVTEAHPGAAPQVLRDEEAEALYEHLAGVGGSGASGSRGDSASPGRGAGLRVRASVPISRALDLIIVAQNCANANGVALGYRVGAARGRADLQFVAAGEGASGSDFEPGSDVPPVSARSEPRRLRWAARSFVTGGSGSAAPGLRRLGRRRPRSGSHEAHQRAVRPQRHPQSRPLRGRYLMSGQAQATAAKRRAPPARPAKRHRPRSSRRSTTT